MARSFGAGAAVALVAFAVYLATLCPTIAAGDSGELATAAVTLGLAHPPGFPLWTLIGRVTTLVADPLRPIVALNVFSALCAAGAAGLLVVLLHLMTDRLVISAGLALAFALSRAVWSTAVVTEVYALNLLLTAAALTATVAGRVRDPRHFALAAYLVGLGAANHPFALLALPPLLFAAAWPREGDPRRLASLAAAFVLGLSVYLYLPIRLVAGPEINWGGMRSIVDVVDHVLRTQYGGLGEAAAHTSLAQRWRVLAGVVGRSVPWPLMIAALAGLAILVRRPTRGVALLIPLFVLCAGPLTAAAIRYEDTFLDRSVVTPFFLPVVLGLFAAAGVAVATLEDSVRRRLAVEPQAALVVAAALAFLPPLFLAEANYSACNRRASTIARDYGTRLLESLPMDARLFLQGDNAMFAVLYLQRAEGLRPDVRLGDRTLNLLVDAYGDDFPGMTRVARRDAMVERERNIAFAEKARPLFYAEEIDLTQFGGARLVPAGLVQQLLRPGETPAVIADASVPVASVDPDDYMECHVAGVALYREATWLAWSNRPEEAKERYYQGAEVAWRIPSIVRNCGIGFLELSDFEEAERLFTRTLELEPMNEDALYDLAGLLAYTDRHEEAIALYARLDSLDTGFAEVSLNYAAALLRVGRLEEAGRQAQKALRIAPDLAPAQRIDEAVRQGLARGGEEGVLEAQRLAGSLAVDGTLQLAQRYLDRGDWERATELFREASAQAPDQTGAAYGLGYGLLRVGRYREAADAFRRLLQIDPKSADGRNALAYVFAQTGDSLQVAERLAREALELNPALAAYWRDTLGWVQYRAGRYSAALESLQESERALPVDDLSMRAENHYHLGKVLLALGREAEAREYFEKSALRAKSESWVADLTARRKELGDRSAT